MEIVALFLYTNLLTALHHAIFRNVGAKYFVNI